MAEDNKDDDKDKPTVESLTAELERINVKYGLEKGHRKTAETNVKEFERRIGSIEDERKAEKKLIDDERERLEMESHKKKGDVDALENSWKEKNQKVISDAAKDKAIDRKMINDLTVGQAAQRLASRLAGEDSHLLLPIIKNRLRSEITDGKAHTRVLDSKGEASALTLDELQAEIYNDKQYSRIIVSSNGSGGGADGSSAKGGSSAKTTITRAAFDAMGHSERGSYASEGGKVVD